MRVLVVEDEPDLQRAIVRALREEGYAVDAVGDGDEGAFKAVSWEYDAVVLDLMLPRSIIYDHLFDENDDTLSNLTDVHISNIRKKLGKDFIVTRRGQGYLIGSE